MRIGKIRIERQRLLGVTTHPCEGLSRWERCMCSEPEIAVRQPGVGLGEICIQSEGALKMRPRLVHSIRATMQLKASFEIRLVRLDVRRLP